MMTRKAFSFALPMVLLAAACSDNSDTAPDPDATMTVEPDGGIGDGVRDGGGGGDGGSSEGGGGDGRGGDGGDGGGRWQGQRRGQSRRA